MKNHLNSMYQRRESSQLGFTLTELLVTLGIVALLILAMLIWLSGKTHQARDAQRKADLEEIKVAFEDYHNDNGCYPPLSILDDCRGDSFQPYLSMIPCDPVRDEPYFYQPLKDNQCRGYRLYARLDNALDPVIAKLGCDGPGECNGYNYGISVGAPLLFETASPTPTPQISPTPSPKTIYVYACDAGGVCNIYASGHPDLESCPVTFVQSNCNNACGNPANRCD